MNFELENFSLVQMLRCGRGVRQAAESATSIEEAANAIVGFLYANCRFQATGAHSCALIRFYMTQPYSSLDQDLRSFADRQLAGARPRLAMKCLTLMATVGQRPEWCDRRQSAGHKAIPLPSESIVEQAPMIAQLIRQMGLDISVIVEPSPDVVAELAGKTYNVFHVPEADGSPHIPAQEEFVRPYGIRSVVGFGGVVHTGELFAVIMFSRAAIPAESAARFRNIALDVKSAIYPLHRMPAFEPARAWKAR